MKWDEFLSNFFGRWQAAKCADECVRLKSRESRELYGSYCDSDEEFRSIEMEVINF